MPDETNSDTVFNFDIFPENKGSVSIYIPPNSLVDSAGNGNNQIIYSFLFQVSVEKVSVPATNEWGKMIFVFILICSSILVMRRRIDL